MPANHHQIIMTQSEDERLHDSDDDDSIKEELDVRSGLVKQLFTRRRCQSQPERGMTCNQLMHLQETTSPWRIHHSFVTTKGRCCWMRCGQNISPPTEILILSISTTAGAGVPIVPVVVITIVVGGLGAPVVPIASFIAAPFVGVGAPVIPIVVIIIMVLGVGAPVVGAPVVGAPVVPVVVVVVPSAAAPAAASTPPTASAFCFARLLALRLRSLIFSASRFVSVSFARLRALRLRALALQRSMMVDAPSIVGCCRTKDGVPMG